jgi:hypothetical protein
MLAAEIQDRPQQRRLRAGVPATVVIAWGQIGQESLAGRCPEGASCQIPNRAQRQVELPGDLGRSGPEAGHLSDGQSQGKLGGAWHRSRLPEPATDGILGLYPIAESHETFVSGFRTKHGVR